MRRTSDAATDLGLLAMAVIWGVNFSVLKVALEELAPLPFNALRFPLAALVVLLLLRSRGPLPWPERRDLPRILSLGLLGNPVYQLFFIYGIDATRAGNASLLLATTPVWTIVLSTATGHERPAASVWAGVMGTVLGMVLVVAGGGEGLGVSRETLRGDLLMVGAAMIWSGYTVGSRSLIQRYGSVPLTAWTLWVGTPFLVLLGLPGLAEGVSHVSLAGWLGVAYAGGLAIAVAYVLWYRGVSRIGNARTAVYSNLVPVVALAAAWLWLAERPTALQLAGAVAILGSLTLARVGRGGRRTRAAETGASAAA